MYIRVLTNNYSHLQRSHTRLLDAVRIAAAESHVKPRLMRSRAINDVEFRQETLVCCKNNIQKFC